MNPCATMRYDSVSIGQLNTLPKTTTIPYSLRGVTQFRCWILTALCDDITRADRIRQTRTDTHNEKIRVTVRMTQRLSAQRQLEGFPVVEKMQQPTESRRDCRDVSLTALDESTFAYGTRDSRARFISAGNGRRASTTHTQSLNIGRRKGTMYLTRTCIRVAQIKIHRSDFAC